MLFLYPSNDESIQISINSKQEKYENAGCITRGFLCIP